MRRVAVQNISRSGMDLGHCIGVANTFWTRLKGLLGAPPLRPGEGLLLDPCQAVHMYGMKQALDVAFLGGEGEVVAVYHDLQPGRRSKYHRKAQQALELPVGTLRSTDTRVGDRLLIQPLGEPNSIDGENDER